MRQVKASKTKLDVSEQIFDATDRLMAKEGLHYLSMHKLAKEAGIAAGTIYLYFKSKDELLAQFVRRVFNKLVVQLKKVLMKINLFSNNTEKCGGIFGIFFKKIQRFC